MIQALFFIPNFQQKILTFESSSFQEELAHKVGKLDQNERGRIQKSIHMIECIQELFIGMLQSDDKY